MICLNMIVKNESEVIEATLTNLCEHLNFSYWVISDTGSTDNTKEIIKDFFEKKGIPGELVEHEWKDFAYNRTKALECAYQKSDYLFIFDADDRIHGKLVLPKLTSDRYMLQIGKEFSYERALLITNRKPWFYVGVLHEYLDCKEPRTVASLKGDYWIESGRTGYRSKNPNKYADDAIILKKAFEEDASLKTRYAFYCAQSYIDAENDDEAIEWYKKCVSMNGWDQERYYSCLQLGELFRRKKDYLNMQLYWARSCQYDPERIEAIVMLMGHYHQTGQHVLVNAMYHKWKDYSHTLQGKLFIRTFIYDYELEYLNALSGYYARDVESGYACCKTVILHHKDPIKKDLVKRSLVMYQPLLQRDKKMMEYLKAN
jgi:glycosyltransferase involved in cell wall biosynthesis